MEVKELQKRVEELEEARNRIKPQWEEIARYVTPGRGVFDDAEPNQGDRKDRDLLDATPFQALTTLAAGMQGGLTSPSRPWFKLGVTDPELGDYEPVRVWLDEVERRMLHVLGRSNAYNGLHTLYAEVGAFGTGALYIEEDPMEVLRCTALTAGEYAVAFDSRGMPSEFCRTFWMSAPQMADAFGYDALSDAVRSALDNGRRGQWFRVHHLIFPNDDFSPLEKEDRPAKNMPWASVYWEHGKDKPLRVSGYEEFPVLVPRWDVVGADFYGRGPGWAALGESKMLQELRFDYLEAQKIAIRPPVMGPTGLKNARANLTAGAVTFYDGPVGLQPIYQVRPDIPGQLQAIAESRQLIQRFFYADLFLMLAANDVNNRDMTAREVAERHEEKMLMLGPVLERLENELLDPLIERVFAIMDRMGLMPPPPEDLGGKLLQVEYISILAQAQRMVGIEGIERLADFVGRYAPLKPDALDKVDFDEAIDQYAKKLGVPAAVIVSDENVAAIREQRAQQQAQMEQMAAMQQAAQTAQQGAGAVNQMAQAAEGGGLGQVAELLGGGEEMA